MRDLRSLLRLGLDLLTVGFWFLETIWLGGLGLWRIVVLAIRWPDVFAETRLCSRGHATAMYGVFECRCGALIEDWVFARCRICGHSAGWTPCTDCGLPIRNPLLV
jgi:hypothetical protein